MEKETQKRNPTDPATVGQLKYLSGLGFRGDTTTMTVEQASTEIDKLKAARELEGKGKERSPEEVGKGMELFKPGATEKIVLEKVLDDSELIMKRINESDAFKGLTEDGKIKVFSTLVITNSKMQMTRQINSRMSSRPQKAGVFKRKN